MQNPHTSFSKIMDAIAENYNASSYSSNCLSNIGIAIQTSTDAFDSATWASNSVGMCMFASNLISENMVLTKTMACDGLFSSNTSAWTSNFIMYSLIPISEKLVSTSNTVEWLSNQLGNYQPTPAIHQPSNDQFAGLSESLHTSVIDSCGRFAEIDQRLRIRDDDSFAEIASIREALAELKTCIADKESAVVPAVGLEDRTQSVEIASIREALAELKTCIADKATSVVPTVGPDDRTESKADSVKLYNKYTMDNSAFFCASNTTSTIPCSVWTKSLSKSRNSDYGTNFSLMDSDGFLTAPFDGVYCISFKVSFALEYEDGDTKHTISLVDTHGFHRLVTTTHIVSECITGAGCITTHLAAGEGLSIQVFPKTHNTVCAWQGKSSLSTFEIALLYEL